jgi:hypothetical protein
VESYVILSGSDRDPKIGWIVAGEWLKYTLCAPADGTHRVGLRYSANETAQLVEVGVSVNLATVASVKLTRTKGTCDWKFALLCEPTVRAGEIDFKLLFVDVGLHADYVEFSAVNPTTLSPPLTSGTCATASPLGPPAGWYRGWPYFGAPQPIQARILAVAFDCGGEGVAFHEVVRTPLDQPWTGRSDAVDMDVGPDGAPFVRGGSFEHEK